MARRMGRTFELLELQHLRHINQIIKGVDSDFNFC